MRMNLVTTAVVGTLCGVLALGNAMAQGPGNGRGAGRGRGNGVCMGVGPGTAAAGGWWTRVTPNTPQQKAFVAQVTNLHNSIRQANLDVVALRSRNATPAEIAAKQQQITALRAELQKTTTANQALLRELGVPTLFGVCDGTGPKGPGGGMGMRRGFGAGAGMGRGMGRGLRDGTGPNPNCPLK